MTQRPINEDDLQAYVDEALDQRRRTEVETFLDQNPAIAERVQADRLHREALRAALAPVAAEPVPARLNLASVMENARNGTSRPWRAAAASVGLLLAGGAMGFGLSVASAAPSSGIASLAEEAADSYSVFAPDLGRPVEIAANDEAQLVRWASRRLDRAVKVPDLSSTGFEFLGGRVVPTPHGPAAFYMYDNDRGTRIVMLARNMEIDRNAAMKLDRSGSVATVSWADDGLGYSMVGPIGSGDLHDLANRARNQLRDPV